MTGLAVVRAIHLAAAIQTIGALLFVWIVEDAPLLRFRPRTSTLSGLLVRLAFSDHEKLSHQRWLDRIPAEEPFKSAKLETVRMGDPEFPKIVELFDSLD